MSSSHKQMILREIKIAWSESTWWKMDRILASAKHGLSWWEFGHLKNTPHIFTQTYHTSCLKRNNNNRTFYAKLLEIWSYKFYHMKENPILRLSPRYVMQMLTLLVIFESVAFHGEISCTTNTLYSMDQMHLIIISPIGIYFWK